MASVIAGSRAQTNLPEILYLSVLLTQELATSQAGSGPSPLQGSAMQVDNHRKESSSFPGADKVLRSNAIVFDWPAGGYMPIL